MSLTRAGAIFIVSIFLFNLIVSIFTYSNVVFGSFDLILRLLALNGFFLLSITSIMSAFIKEIYKALGKPFLRVHHVFAAIGLTLITLHPIVYVIQTLNLRVFLPNLGSITDFFTMGGSVALILIYVSFTVALLMKRIPKYFRKIHQLVIVALFFAVIHANLLGVDFSSIPLRITYDILFLATVGAYILKRYRVYKAKKLKQKPLLPL
ncbi:MAG: hypothetical protein QG670_119 [Thermoproteota archaeon]|nr:hypothetical protein [Thermoproteota archaeon]